MDCTNDNTRCEERLAALARSNFRSRFHLALRDRQYICDKGWDVMRRHAADFVAQRLAPAVIPNDGKQTPMRGHPVFIAQHAPACCCRGCLAKWHGIPAGRALTDAEQRYIVGLLLFWMQREMTSPLPVRRRGRAASLCNLRKNLAFFRHICRQIFLANHFPVCYNENNK